MSTFQTAAVFGDHMVLQRGKNIAVFGEGEDGKRVTVTLELPGRKRTRDEKKQEEKKQDGQTAGGDAVTVSGMIRGGRFQVTLPPQEAGEGYSMTVRCGEEEKRFADIAVGEVWLAGGQSNMELELSNAYEGAGALREDGAQNGGKGPDVRFYYTQKIAYMDDSFFEKEAKTGWKRFGDPGTGAWSAVGYFFARKLASELGVTVGVIGCNWGGTSASAWMDRESLTEDAELRSYVEEYETAIAGKSVQEQIREYDEYEAYHAVWSKKAEELAKIDPMLPWEEVLARCGECKWPGPMNCKNPFRPSGLYECMLKRIIPYTLRGVIWYQGESDDHKPRTYERLFRRMIEVWRREWQDLTMPFLFVQLPMHRYQQDPDFKNWPLIREAQTNVYRTVKNTGMAVITEYSEWAEIHPRRKQQVGERLERQAMYHVYHAVGENDAFGPMYRDKIVHPAKEGQACGTVELLFDDAQDGFYVSSGPFIEKAYRADGTVILPEDGCACAEREGAGSDESGGKGQEKEPKKAAPAPGTTEARERTDAPGLSAEEMRSHGFEIAGEDGRFVPADYAIAGDRIVVWAESVPEPAYVRYLWTNYRIPHIFGARTGIPLAPFRTDMRDEEKTAAGSAGIRQLMEL